MKCAGILSAVVLVLALGQVRADEVVGRGPMLERAFAAAFAASGPQIEDADGTAVDFKPGRLVLTGFGPVLLSPGFADAPSPATFGTLAVHYLRAEGDGFALAGAWPFAIGGGAMGNPPDWELDSRLTRWPVVVARTLEGGQGIFGEFTALYSLTPGGPKPLGGFRSSYSDASGQLPEGQAPEIQGRIVRIEKDSAFEVEFTGTARFRQIYRLGPEGYALAESTGALPPL